MKLTYLWPLFLLLLIPVIIVMYLLKQRALQRPVSSLFLWHEMYQNAEANTPWEKLKKNWLLILQIITLLILIFAVCSPYFLKGGVGADHAVIVIDNSAGMGTIYEGEKTRLDVAIEEAVSYVRDLRSGTGITVIASSVDGTLMYSNGDNKNQAIDKIRSIEQTSNPGDAHAGLEMVRTMQTQWDSVETVCFTDTYASMEEITGYVVDLYQVAENISIDYVSHGYNEGKLVILAKICNYGTQDVVVDANLYGGDALLQILSVSVPAGESQIVYFDDFNYQGKEVAVELSAKDALSADNIAYDVLEEDNVIEVLFMTEANLYLEKAMGVLQGINVTKSNDILSFDDFKKQEYDVYIFDGMVPAVLPEQGSMIFMNVKETELFAFESLLQGVLVEPQKHEITQYLEDLSFGVSDTYSYQVPSWAEEVFKSGTHTIAFAGEYEKRNVCVLGFDLHNSDLPLKTEFPVLVYNMLNASSKQSLVEGGIYYPGDSVNIFGKMNESLPVVILPDETEQELKDYQWSFADTAATGIYHVRQNTAKGVVQEAFAVNFPGTESHVMQTPTAMSGGGDMVKTSVSGVLDLRNIIILITLLFLGIEWIAYLRK